MRKDLKTADCPEHVHSFLYLLASTSSYAARVSAAVLRQLNWAARCSERARRSFANALSLRTLRMASTSAWVSLGSTLIAASPTTSGSDVRFEQTTGAPQLMASKGSRPNPS